MELKDFVSQTLLAISEGIMEAQAKTGASGLIIAPPLTDEGIIQVAKDGRKKPHIVHFNLKVAVDAKGEQGNAGGGFSIQVLNVSVSGKSGSRENSSISSSTMQEISFDIPVLWPTNARQVDVVAVPAEEYDPFKY